MAKKKATKEIKRLKKRAKKVTAANLTLEKRVWKLRRRLEAREREIANLQGRLEQKQPVADVSDSLTAKFGDREGSDIASSQRSAWKQHSYLRDRYEFHLVGGATKERARHLANEDLKQAHGMGRGYTEEELAAILS